MSTVMISDIVQRIENLPPSVLHEFLKDLVLFMYRGGCSEFGGTYDHVNGSIESTSEFPSGSDVCDAIAQNIEEMGILAPSRLPSRLYQVVTVSLIIISDTVTSSGHHHPRPLRPPRRRKQQSMAMNSLSPGCSSTGRWFHEKCKKQLALHLALIRSHGSNRF